MMNHTRRLLSAFRTIGAAFCLAVASMVAPAAWAVDMVSAVDSLRQSQMNGFGRAQAKFKVDLAHQAGLAGDRKTAVDSSLVPASHGFRQPTAEIEPLAEINT